MSKKFINSKQIDPQQNLDVHFLPCTITQLQDKKLPYTQDAKVGAYFTPIIDVKNMEKTVSLHGRRLIGQEVKFEDNKNLLILKKEDGFQIIGIEKKINYWKWDESSQENDKVQQLFHFSDILNSLHKPIEFEN